MKSDSDFRSNRYPGNLQWNSHRRVMKKSGIKILFCLTGNHGQAIVIAPMTRRFHINCFAPKKEFAYDRYLFPLIHKTNLSSRQNVS